jgi:hypothetical protein
MIVPDAVLVAAQAGAANGQEEEKRKRRRRKQLLPGMVRAKDAASWSSVRLRTWRAWDAAGKVPRPLRIGACTLWSLPELRKWRDAGCPPRDEWEVLKLSKND